MKITEQVAQFAQPVVEANGCQLWDVEYVREGSERYLRLYIDKDGGIDIEDCEKIHRAIDPILDEKDPIAESYHFEVCSAGIERPLKRPTDFEKFMGSPILVKLYRYSAGLRRRPGHSGSRQGNHHLHKIRSRSGAPSCRILKPKFSQA